MIKIEQSPERKPDWLKVKLITTPNYSDMKNLMSKHTLNTVCEEARCPNIYECWDNRTATVMILGDTCTRSCGFCSVKTGKPNNVDSDEPKRVADLVEKLSLRHVVVTSVDRDDLKDDYGSQIWHDTVIAIKEKQGLNEEAKKWILKAYDLYKNADEELELTVKIFEQYQKFEGLIQ